MDTISLLQALVSDIAHEIDSLDDAQRVVSAMDDFGPNTTPEEIADVASETLTPDTGAAAVSIIADLGADLIESEGGVFRAWLSRAYAVTLITRHTLGHVPEASGAELLMAAGGPTVTVRYGADGTGGFEVLGYWGGDERTARAWSDDLGDELTELMASEAPAVAW